MQLHTKVTPDKPVVEQVVGYMRTLVCIVEANPSPNTNLEIDNPQLRFVKDGQTVIPDERYVSRLVDVQISVPTLCEKLQILSSMV